MTEQAALAPNGEGPIYSRVIERIRSRIIAGEYPADSWLKVGDLARELEVSAQPVREALQVLQGEGLLMMLPNRGARVRGVDRNRLNNIYDIREAIEAFMTRRFAEEAALSDIRRLEGIQAAHDAAIAADDMEAIIAANHAFHELIAMHSGNDEAIAIRERYFALSSSLRRRFGFSSARWSEVQADHHELIEAFRRRDAEAAYAVASRHVRGTRDELLAQMEAGGAFA